MIHPAIRSFQLVIPLLLAFGLAEVRGARASERSTVDRSVQPRRPSPALVASADLGGAGCTAGQACTTPAPTFACDYAAAERIAAAGPAAGRDLGLTLVRAKACQIAPAGLSVEAEATPSARVLYLTHEGKHLGYMPVGVSAPVGSATLTSCQDSAFCAVRSGAPAWACPEAGALALPTNGARGGAGCIAVEAGNTGEVVQGTSDAGPIAILFGGDGGRPRGHFVARGDLEAVAMSSMVTPAERGWCKPGDTCVTSAPTLLCQDRAAYARLLALPLDEARRVDVLMEAGCRRLLRGNPRPCTWSSSACAVRPSKPSSFCRSAFRLRSRRPSYVVPCW